MPVPYHIHGVTDVLQVDPSTQMVTAVAPTPPPVATSPAPSPLMGNMTLILISVAAGAVLMLLWQNGMLMRGVNAIMGLGGGHGHSRRDED